MAALPEFIPAGHPAIHALFVYPQYMRFSGTRLEESVMQILFISLGCDKNLVDTEHMLGKLAGHGYEMTDDCLLYTSRCV